MKQFFTFLGIVAMGATAYGQEDTDIVRIPDKNFKRALVSYMPTIDTDGDREISYGEARATKSLYVSKEGISSLIGIEAFVNIVSLYCDGNQLTSLDVSNNIALQSLYCNGNQLTSLDVSNNIALQRLFCYNNKFTNLDVKNKALQELNCSENQLLKSLNVNGATALQRLYCSMNNQLTSLDVSGATALQTLYCSNNRLTNLDVSKNTALQTLYCSNNQLTNLDVSKNTALRGLYCSRNQLTSLDVSKNTALTYLDCYNNQLTSLDVSKNTALRSLECYNNQLTQLNIANVNNRIFHLGTRNNPNLMCIQIDGRPISWSKDSHTSFSANCNYPTLSTTEVKAEQTIQILNPVKDNLVIKTTAKIERVEIYNTAGQLVKVLFQGNTAVQDLAKGIYLIRVTTDKGVIIQKIIKQ